jgi:hypothetical protein
MLYSMFGRSLHTRFATMNSVFEVLVLFYTQLVSSEEYGARHVSGDSMFDILILFATRWPTYIGGRYMLRR